MESSFEEVNDILKTLVRNSKSPPTNAQIVKEIWTHAQLYLQLQKKFADATHNIHMELIRNMVDARYKDTQSEIKAIKDHLLQTTCSTLKQSYPVDDAKRGG
ncbi:hypothetical protein Hanom_Chr03g00213911 [Helianthus anomalus]